MKRLSLILLFFALLFSGSLKAQEREVITETRKESTRSDLTETYSVLRSDKTVKDGPYEMLRNNKPIVMGYYKNGQKDSLWQVFGRETILSKKWFAEGKKTGLWEFFDYKGLAEWSYDFTSGQAAFQKPKGKITRSFYQVDTGEWVSGPTDNPVLPLVGSGEWLSYLNRTFRYPNEAVANEQQGEVIVGINVDENGNVTDYTVFQSGAPSLDQEALRVIKLYPYEFIPAEKDGKKITSQYRMPVVFRIDPH